MNAPPIFVSLGVAVAVLVVVAVLGGAFTSRPALVRAAVAAYTFAAALVLLSPLTQAVDGAPSGEAARTVDTLAMTLGVAAALGVTIGGLVAVAATVVAGRIDRRRAGTPGS